MRAHTIAGEPAAALTAYEQLRTTLADELGTDPAPETQSLHLAILRADQAAPDPAGPRSRQTPTPAGPRARQTPTPAGRRARRTPASRC